MLLGDIQMLHVIATNIEPTSKGISLQSIIDELFFIFYYKAFKQTTLQYIAQ